METIFTMGDFSLTSFGLGMALAMVVLALGMGLWNRRKSIGGYATLVRFMVLALPMGWVFSRLIYVLANITYYTTTLSNPVLALHFWDGGYSVTGCVMGVMLAAFLTEKWVKQPCGAIMDAAAFALPLGIIVERVMETGTGLGLGRPIAYDWLLFMGVEDGMGDVGSPVLVFDVIAAFAVFVGVCLWQRKRGFSVRHGDTAWVTLTLLCACQVIMESLRNDGHMVVHFVRIQQVVSLITVVIAIAVFVLRLAKAGGMKKSPQLALWLVVLACVGMGIFMEFRVDRGEMKMLYYAVMALCMAVLAVMALKLRTRAEKA